MLAATTALIVAHRPSTVMLADRVALLEDGRITAVGTHSELLATSEHYRFVISSLEDERRAGSRREVGRVSTVSVTGVEGEERARLHQEESQPIRRRSLRLLGSLLRPLRAQVVLTIVVVVVSTAAQVAGPALIAFGIDHGLPAC